MTLENPLFDPYVGPAACVCCELAVVPEECGPYVVLAAGTGCSLDGPYAVIPACPQFCKELLDG